MKTLSPTSVALVFGIAVLVGAGSVYYSNHITDKEVASSSPIATPTPRDAAIFTIKDESGTVLLTGEDITGATAELGPNHFDSSEAAELTVAFTPSGKDKLARATAQNIGKTLPVYVDGRLVSSPMVLQSITDGQVVVTGDFTLAEAQEMAAKINR